jgi:hypothetical protein
MRSAPPSWASSADTAELTQASIIISEFRLTIYEFPKKSHTSTGNDYYNFIFAKKKQRIMPEEIEVPTEQLHEELENETHHSQERWIMMVALTAALLSVLAAITALFAGHYANEAMIEQIQASDQWAFYQAKGIKSSVLESKMELLTQMGKEADPKDVKNAERYKDEQKDIKNDATEKQESSARYLVQHNALAKGVTLFQIAIAICAISALTRKKWLWYGSILLGIAGIILVWILI